MKNVKIKKFNYFYKIENLINSNFYFGVHRTDNLDDDYMGSGVRLKRAYKKYGEENFKKEILLFFDNYNEALDYEAEFVSEQLILDPSCYNLKPGGSGGFCNEEHRIKAQSLGGKKSIYYLIEKIKNDIDFNVYFSASVKAGLDKKRETGWINRGFKNKHHSSKTIKNLKKTFKIINHQQGEKNSQYKTHWITNNKENKKIHDGDLIPKGWMLGRNIKK